MNNFIEEKKNKVKPSNFQYKFLASLNFEFNIVQFNQVYYLENGPFSSHAPVYDSSYSNLSKEESDILLSSYGDETGYQYALSLIEFAKGTTPEYNTHINTMLNELSSNEHEKYVKYLQNKKETADSKTSIESNATINPN